MRWVGSSLRFAARGSIQFLIVTRGTKHSIMRNGCDAVAISQPNTNGISDQVSISSLDECGDDTLLKGSEDLKAMLLYDWDDLVDQYETHATKQR